MKPTIIAVTDLPAAQAKQQRFLNDSIIVRSRSGLHPTETLLLTHLTNLAPLTSSVVVTGNRTGVIPLVLNRLAPDAKITAHAYDSLHASTIQRTLNANNAPEAIAVSGVATIGETQTSPPQLVVAQISHNAIPLELLQELIQDIHQTLADNGELLMAFEGKAEWLREQLKKVFGKASVTVTKGMALARAVRQRPLAKLKNFSAAFEVSLPQQIPFTMTTIPGIFAHRRADQGGLALAEIAAREVGAGETILDIGCGCGLVGVALGRIVPSARVTFLDSQWRAMASARHNAAANGLQYATFLCDHTDAAVGAGQFTLVAGNPPYFSDYAIAQHFIETAYKALRVDGRCLMVAKSASWHVEHMTKVFGNAEPVKRRGYTVVSALKRR